MALGRHGVDRVRTRDREKAPFVLRLADGTDILARAVIDASGTWTTPNVLGANGLPAHGEHDADPLIDHALPDVLGADRDWYAGRHTVVVGAGHSAANTLLDLAALAQTTPGTRITWALRTGAADRTFGGEDDDALPARGALGSGLRRLVDSGAVTLVTGFRVHTVRPTDHGVELVSRDGRTLTADRVVSATGYRPDHTIAEELRLDLDPALGCTRALAPLIDPNEHSCGTVRPHGVDELSHPEPGYWTVGMKSYGRAPTFLDDLATQHGLSPEIPGKLITGALRHAPSTGTIAAAVDAAATELGLDPHIAQQLAAAAGDRFDLPVAPAGRQLVTAPGNSASVCCG